MKARTEGVRGEVCGTRHCISIAGMRGRQWLGCWDRGRRERGNGGTGEQVMLPPSQQRSPSRKQSTNDVTVSPIPGIDF